MSPALLSGAAVGQFCGITCTRLSAGGGQERHEWSGLAACMFTSRPTICTRWIEISSAISTIAFIEACRGNIQDHRFRSEWCSTRYSRGGRNAINWSPSSGDRCVELRIAHTDLRAEAIVSFILMFDCLARDFAGGHHGNHAGHQLFGDEGRGRWPEFPPGRCIISGRRRRG